MTEASKNKVLIFLIAILLLINIGMVIFIIRKSPEKRPHGEERMKRDGITELLQKQVGFNGQQVKQYEQLRNEHWSRAKPLFEEMRAAKENFFKLLDQPTVSDTTLERAANRIGETQKALDMQLFQHFRQVKALCTPEQQPKFDSLVKTVTRRMSAPFFRNKMGPPPFSRDSIAEKRRD